MNDRFFLEGGFEILRFEKFLLVQPVFMKSILFAATYNSICKLEKKNVKKDFECNYGKATSYVFGFFYAFLLKKI